MTTISLKFSSMPNSTPDFEVAIRTIDDTNLPLAFPSDWSTLMLVFVELISKSCAPLLEKSTAMELYSSIMYTITNLDLIQ